MFRRKKESNNNLLVHQKQKVNKKVYVKYSFFSFPLLTSAIFSSASSYCLSLFIEILNQIILVINLKLISKANNDGTYCYLIDLTPPAL